MKPRRQAAEFVEVAAAEPAAVIATTAVAANGGEVTASARVPAAEPAQPMAAPGGTEDDAAEHAGDQPAAAPRRASPPGLSARLTALARLIQIGAARSGRDGFGKQLLADAEDVLSRTGERMRLSAGHTVVALAGGTGSGKSSLFNRLAGAEFSTVGVTRQVTKEPHACAWGMAGAGALLEWLAVPGRNRYSRGSALDRGEADLAGLVLLDLPDHDSVLSYSSIQSDRMVGLSDVMIWVLDPQKYADAAVHRRYLMPLAGHSTVITVVLNQSDLLDETQTDECVADLRRLLDTENLHDVRILVTSAVTGAGLDELRLTLATAVAARRAAADRIAADVDVVAARFAPFAGDADADAGGVSPERRQELADRFAAAAGVAAIADALRSARELRAADFVGWPVGWLIQRLTGRDPLRKVRLGMLWNDLRSVSAGPSAAQQAEIDLALTELGDQLAGQLPKPWSQTVRAAVRSQAGQIPGTIGAALSESLPAEKNARWWWWLGDLWQGLLAGCAGLGIAWLVLIGISHAAGTASGGLRTLADVSLLPVIAAGVVVALALGWLTERVCLRIVRGAAEAESLRIAGDMRDRITAVARSKVVFPAEQELAELARYREEIKIAARPADLEAARSPRG